MKKKIIVLGIIFIVCCLITSGILYKTNQQKKKNEEIKSKEGMRITLIGGSNMADKGNINSMGYVIRTNQDKLIIVDGGRDIDAPYILDYINRYDNGKVDYWYITHAHKDHVGAVLKLLSENDIEIENLYYHFNTKEWYEQYDSRGKETEIAMIDALENEKIKNKIDCQKGKVIQMDNINCEILRIADPAITSSDNGNETSMVFKMTAIDVDKSMLFLGDAFNYTSEELLKETEKLSSYAVQMAHHGQNGVTKEVYDYIRPTISFFNCPENLYNNDNGGGIDSGTYKTIIVRSWLEEYGTRNFVAFNGDQTVQLCSEGYKVIEN